MVCYGVYLNFFLIIINVRPNLGDYTISKQTTKWTAALHLEQCQVATPKIITCLRPGHRCSLEIKIKDILTDVTNEELWVGYYTINAQLFPHGCLDRSNIPADYGHLQRRNYRNYASECFRKCSPSTFIGISELNCYCLEDLNDDRGDIPSGCQNQCEDHACERKTLVSVYKTVENDETSSSKENENIDQDTLRTAKAETPYNVDIIVKYGAKETPQTTSQLTDITATTANRKTTKPILETTVKSNKMNNTESIVLNTTENNDAKVAALVSVGVVLAIINAVVIAVFVNRRNKISHCFDKTSKRNERVTAQSPEYNNSVFACHVQTNDINQHTLNAVEYNYPDFSMLNMMNYDEDVNASVSQRTKAEFPINDLEKHVYDKSDDGDEYNIISNRPKMVAVETYDHTIPVTKSRINSSDDTNYDLSMSADAHIQGKLGGLTDNVYDTENVTYNELGDDMPEVRNATDNLYGTKQRGHVEAF